LITISFQQAYSILIQTWLIITLVHFTSLTLKLFLHHLAIVEAVQGSLFALLTLRRAYFGAALTTISHRDDGLTITGGHIF
jgi:hypothetical protein